MVADTESFRVVWEAQGLESRTMTLGVTQTLVPPATLLARDQRGTLPRILSTAKQTSQLEVVGEIGKGGMGVVRLARQIALKRDVAIKQVRDDRRTERHAEELLKEGLLVGALEHPNIIPVYMLGEDDDGFPTIVMKRIEGENWGELLRGGGDRGDGDPLGWHLDVLMDVCNAVHFAHCRGIVHRDLKPDNVMVGPFGEVYLLDWGIAVSTSDAPHGPFPRSLDWSDIAGTPAYMAPEQARGDAAAISPRTDVYLLGAMLHEVVTGEPPHDGASMFEVLCHAYESAPIDYDEEVPAELARICRRAMAAAAADRFDSAESFRRALQTYQRHRDSMELADAGLGALTDLERAIAAEDAEACDEAYGAGKFSFDAALATWAENDAATDGRHRLQRAMLGWVLRVEDAHAARRLVKELGDIDAATVARVETLEASDAERKRAVQRIEGILADADMAQYAKWRGIGLVTMAFAWLAGLAVHTVWPLGHPQIIGVALLALLDGVIVALVSRLKFSANRVNLQLWAANGIAGAAMIPAHASVYLTGLPDHVAPMMDLIGFSVVGFMMAVTIDRRLVITGVLHLSGFVWVVADPPNAVAALCVSSFLADGAFGAISLRDWRRGDRATGYLT